MEDWIYGVVLRDGPQADTIREIGKVFNLKGYPTGIYFPQNGDGWTYRFEKPLEPGIIRDLLDKGFIRSMYSPLV